jgi:hypothetical protein
MENFIFYKMDYFSGFFYWKATIGLVYSFELPVQNRSFHMDVSILFELFNKNCSKMLRSDKSIYTLKYKIYFYIATTHIRN